MVWLLGLFVKMMDVTVEWRPSCAEEEGSFNHRFADTPMQVTKRPAYEPEHSSYYYLQLVNPADSPITR